MTIKLQKIRFVGDKQGDHYRVVGSSFMVCASGLETTLGISPQPIDTIIEIEINGIYRAAARERLASRL